MIDVMEIIFEKSSEKITSYDATIEKYFIDNPVKIKICPEGLHLVNDIEISELQISTAQGYNDYLMQEIKFWSENDPKNLFAKFSNINALQSAKRYLDSAVSSSTSYKNYLSNSISSISVGCLYSKTKLAKKLLLLKNEPANFIEGFRLSFTKQPTQGLSNTGNFDGYLAGKFYQKSLQKFIELTEKEVKEFKDNIDYVNSQYTDLNKKYIMSYHTHTEMVDKLNQKIDNTISDLESEKQTYFSDADSRIKHLEDLYQEKLRLQAPAKYWEELKRKYRDEGIVWLIISCVIALSIIVFLTIILFKTNILDQNTDWLNNFKNSAILTVITSIAIYILRLTTKVTLSSFHLSRDAKERENLSYFYLALIEKGAVTEKERAIILNSLFSRSDTGLLKGDSAPAMSSNVSDLVDIFKNNAK